MFGLFKKTGAAEPDDAVDRILRARQQRIDISRQVIPENIAQRMFELAVRNCAIAANGLLTRAALFQRVRGDTAQARAQLLSGNDFLDHAVNAIDKASLAGLCVATTVLGPTDIERAKTIDQKAGAECFVYVANIRDLLCLALLGGEWSKADRLALSASKPVVIDGTSPGEPCFARLLVALVLRDEHAFLENRQHLDAAWRDPAAGDIHFLNTYYRYDRLMDAILKRDESAIDALLKECERLFVARGTDKRLEKGGVLDGIGADDNSRVFDVWATALANFARHCGLQVTHSSSIIPVADFK